MADEVVAEEEEAVAVVAVVVVAVSDERARTRPHATLPYILEDVCHLPSRVSNQYFQLGLRCCIFSLFAKDAEPRKMKENVGGKERNIQNIFIDVAPPRRRIYYERAVAATRKTRIDTDDSQRHLLLLLLTATAATADGGGDAERKDERGLRVSSQGIGMEGKAGEPRKKNTATKRSLSLSPSASIGEPVDTRQSQPLALRRRWWCQ